MFRRFALLLGVVVPSLGVLTIPAHAGPVGLATWGTASQLPEADCHAMARLLKLQNGNWIAACVKGTTPWSLAIFESTDGAHTWSSTPVATIAQTGRLLLAPMMIQLANGDILLTSASVVIDDSYQLPIWKSTDGGHTWATSATYPTIDANEDPPPSGNNHGLWEPFLFVLPNGKLSAIYADETASSNNEQVLSQRVLTDGVWGAKTTVASLSTERPGMPIVAKMLDGRWILVFEVVSANGSHSVYSAQKFSSDGTTWPSGIGTRVVGHTNAPYVTALTDGRLIITSNSNDYSYSNDFGATWLLIDPSPWLTGPDESWPAVYQLSSTEIIGTKGNSDNTVSTRYGTIITPLNNSPDFFDDFADGDDAGWARYGGSYSFSGGTYLLNNAASTGKALAGDESWTNGVVAADVKINTAGGQAQVMNRVTNAGNGADEATGYLAGLTQGDFGTGSVWIGKQTGSFQTLAYAFGTVSQGVSYHLSLETAGDTLKVKVNGVTALTYTDSTNTIWRGQIGVRSHYTDAVFDNVTYTHNFGADDFNDGNDTGWARYGGSVSFSSGAYNFDNATTTGKSIAAGTTISHLTYEIDVKVSSGSGDAGIAFRVTNPGSGADAMNGYYAGINDSANTLLIGRMNGSWTPLASVSTTIATNTWYRLKVVAMGSNIRVYLGDMANPKIQITDATWTSGEIGLRAHRTNASFDNVWFS